ncbi:MAG: sugar fermentation stimulation protein, partial [Herbinix sp.]|nr:sugar fermentation stimulation protein [Herbinix sp.]
MNYSMIRTAIFLSRPNRFLARVLIDGKEELAHVKTTGRCREILLEGASVILEEAANTERKTRYSLIAVYKGNVLINIDSQVPNAVVYEGIQEGQIADIHEVIKLSREVVYGN